ncbi:hypothetical protein CLOSTHATH_05413 [Hungatella hathewayi DSM 13479]|uniref:Uncharacterized protein n=1 Tax=Hungatella hathewayi DSM 13479 TaxID=566550 RepID=D3AP61_9FIRM|nr:hypothetical protein CLOSTHATH_05413 [Hungatella hathewayi DSM 13479]
MRKQGGTEREFFCAGLFCDCEKGINCDMLTINNKLYRRQ